jgi:hydroxypyruvate isomerase
MIADTEDLDAAAEALRSTGMEMLAICTDAFDMTGGDTEAYLRGIRSAAPKAKNLGATKLISQVGPDTGAPRAVQQENIVTCLRAAVPLLEEYGLTLVIEPLNTLVDHKGYYLSDSREGFEIIRKVGNPRVRLLFDIYHQLVMGEDVLAASLPNLPLIGHLHAAGCPGRHELQSGIHDYAPIFAALDAAGAPPCALEYAPTLPPEESLTLTRTLFGA